MSKYISDFILLKEYECHCCSRLPPEFYYNGGGRVDSPPYLYRELFDGFETIREKWGRAINISSGYRCLKKQKELYDQDMTSAIISTHCFGVSLDLDTLNEEETMSLVRVIEKCQPDLRIGYKSYLYRGQSLIHIDTGFRISPSYSKKLYRGARW